MKLIIILLIGAFIGWHIPEPQWAKDFKAKVIEVYHQNVDGNKGETTKKEKDDV